VSYVGLIILALISVGLVLGTAWFLARRRMITPKLVPLITGVAVLVGVLSVAAAFPQPTFVPSTVTAGLRGVPRTDPFYLQGTYLVSWRAAPVGGSSCHLEATLVRAADNTEVTALVSVAVHGSQQQGEAKELQALPGAAYLVQSQSACDWKVIFRPKTG
jgi:hypothetical protein